MEILFVATLLGCSDDLRECDEVASYQMAAQTEDACAELVLSRDDATMVDYPAILAECRVIEETPALIADAS